MTAPVRVYVSAPERLTPTECEVLSEILAAKLEQHLADKAKYLASRPGTRGKSGDAGAPLASKPALSDDEPAPDTLRTGEESK